MTKASGVYAIVHRDSGKLYVGSAVDVAGRWRIHRSHLSRNIHHSRRLQNAWNKHGESAFVFVVIRFCLVTDLISEEQRWIDEMEAAGRHGYNVSPTAGSPLGVKHSMETRAKVAAAQRGKKLTPETRAKIGAASRGRKHTLEAIAKTAAAQRGRKHTLEHRAKNAAAQRGRKHTSEARDKMAAAQTGKKHTPEARDNMAAWQRGRKLTPEHRANMAAAHKGKKFTPERIANMAAANRKRAAEAKAAKLARGSTVQGELFN